MTKSVEKTFESRTENNFNENELQCYEEMKEKIENIQSLRNKHLCNLKPTKFWKIIYRARKSIFFLLNHVL